MRYLIVSVATWVFLVSPSVWGVTEEGPRSGPEVTQELEVTPDEGKQVTTFEQAQSPSDGKLTKEQLRAVIRAKRERLRVAMKARRESLRAEGAEIQQEIMAKKAKIHLHPKEATEAFVQPAN